ncbi:MAG TPA: amidohydrolase, partial [Candidatus Krumholzibacteria bacterium]|nr:amidohydrolase [Candidatus Krumholzibacteria bacterium]
DILFSNGIVWTGTALGGVTAVGVAGDRIVYAGDDAGATRLRGPRTRVVDVRGGLLLPGLVDAHAHLENLGILLGEVSLVGTGSAAEVLALVRAAQSRAAPGAWIHGRGWDQNDWDATAFPTWRDLTGTEANPVYLDRIDGHAIWANRTALDACGITRETPDPAGGRIVRDANGDPTGVLIDNAEALVVDHVPAPSPAELDAILRRTIRECNRVGLTGVHDAGTTPDVLASLRRLGATGELTLNVYAMLDSEHPAMTRAAFRRGPAEEFGGRLVLRCVKLRADGALGSRGAALLASYADDPGNSGLAVTPDESLYVWTAEALRSGFQAATHAIGDRGNHVTLEAYARALAGGRADPRLRIEHCQILAPDDIPRFAALGVVASMQPTHATSDMPWVEARIGRARIAGAYAWRSLLDSGATLAFGSDAPVESIDPLWGIYAAATRRDHAGEPAGGWLPGELVTVAEALSAFTAGAAFAAFEETDAGTIEVGKRADLTMVDRDFRAGPAGAILDARVVMTVVRGAIVFESGAPGGGD